MDPTRVPYFLTNTDTQGLFAAYCLPGWEHGFCRVHAVWGGGRNREVACKLAKGVCRAFPTSKKRGLPSRFFKIPGKSANFVGAIAFGCFGSEEFLQIFICCYDALEMRL